MHPMRARRAVLAVGAFAYAAAVLVASLDPGPRWWALHLPAFLSPPARAAVLTLLFGGALWLAIDSARDNAGSKGTAAARPMRAPERAAGRRVERGREKRVRAGNDGDRFPGWGDLLALPVWALLLWTLRTRAHFLGDGRVWLDGILSRTLSPFSEPLSAAAWKGYAALLRSIGIPVNEETVGAFSILCGILALLLAWGIAVEITPRDGSRALRVLLLLTLGVSQLYFGYIESYPPTSVAILAFLWLGLRLARRRDPPWWTAGVVPVALASHLATVYLLPSYVYLALREKRPLLVRAALVLVPLALAFGLLSLLGYKPANWISSIEIAARAVRPGQDAAVLGKPYAALSLAHGRDLLNAVLLVMPVPALLLAARFAGGARDALRPDGTTLVLAIAALSGIATSVALVLPVSAAQDWDLTSLLLIPAAIFAVKLGASTPGLVSGTRGLAVAAIAVGALLSFVLVNADESASLKRFDTLIAPGAKITPYAKAYGNELLASYYEDRRNFADALLHASRAREAEPTNPRYWIKQGAALYELGRYDEAIPAFQEGIRRGPKRDDGYYNLGNCYVQVGRYEEAAGMFREALRRSAPRPDYMHNLGVALIRSGKPDSARVVWLDVVRRWPGYAFSTRSLMMHFGTVMSESSRVSLPPGRVGAPRR